MYQLIELYRNKVRGELSREFSFSNCMLIPKLEKFVISVGVGSYAKDIKIIQSVADTISLIAGQKSVIVYAKKSVASFKIREGMPVGVKVTLRGKRMYNFLEKLIIISLPRVKDFKGIPVNGFDGCGNFNFGLKEQLIFPEVIYDDIVIHHGMNVSIVTSSSDDIAAFKLLQFLGMPFEKGR